MGLDRTLADPNFVGDVLVRFAHQHAIHDQAFALNQGWNAAKMELDIELAGGDAVFL